jgi:hypothetical protein
MKSSTSFYRLLNQSIEPIDNQTYIEQTSMLMDAVLRTKSTKKTILILGAGNMHDMKLDFFLRNFEQVVLTDIDVVSIKEQLKDAQYSSKIDIREIDYLGLDKSSFIDGLGEELLSTNTVKKLEEIIDRRITKLLSYHFSTNFDQVFDVIYVSPIYTQLLYRQVEQYIGSLSELGLLKEFQEYTLATLLQQMMKVIDHFNQEVYQLLRTDGIMFVASDIFLLQNDTFSLRVKHSIKSYDVMEEILEDYQKTYGMGLGDYGLYSITKLLKVLRSKWFIWFQSKHQTYAVKFRAFEKIDEELGG